MSIDDAYKAGQLAALEKLAFPVSSEMLKKAPGVMKEFLIGSPGKLFVEGRGAFHPGGMLSHENIWWPSTRGLVGKEKIMPWLQRAGTLATPFQLMSAARDPNDGALSNTLSAAGSIAGTMYGMPALGLLGSSALSNAGARLGRGIGHALGSRPRPLPQPQYQPPPQLPPGAY